MHADKIPLSDEAVNVPALMTAAPEIKNNFCACVAQQQDDCCPPGECHYWCDCDCARTTHITRISWIIESVNLTSTIPVTSVSTTFTTRIIGFIENTSYTTTSTTTTTTSTSTSTSLSTSVTITDPVVAPVITGSISVSIPDSIAVPGLDPITEPTLPVAIPTTITVA